MENERPTSIRDIEVSERREEFNHRAVNKTENVKGVSYKAKNKKVWPKFVAFILLAIIIFASVSYFMHSALIKVTPNVEKLTFSNDIYTAVVDENNFTANILENKSVSGKISKGKITIINNTKKSKNLREETRFQIGDGTSGNEIVYKIYNKATIPAGKEITVAAFSDGSGEKYNKEKGMELKIPGFNTSSTKNEYENITGKIAETFATSEDDIKQSENSDKKAEAKKSLAIVKYQVLELSAEDQKEISSIGVEEISKKSTGKIKITNNTSKARKLRKETRFKNGGLVFKTYKSITIPSKASVIAEAFSDMPGENYNVSKGMEFRLPGFDTDSTKNEYENIFGVSETDFAGGKVGKINIPNKNELSAAKEELKKNISDELALQSKNNKTNDDFILIGNNPYLKYDFKTSSADDKVIVKIKATQKTPIISKKNFIAMILKSEDITTEKVDQLEIKDFSKIDFRIVDSENFNIDSGDNFFFSVKGNADISWVLDKELFIKSIKGKTSSEIKEQLSASFKNFEFSMSIAPLWRSVMPENGDDITIEIDN